MTPAARLAIDGFAVTSDMVRYMAAGIGEAGYNFLVEDEDWAKDFAPNGQFLSPQDPSS